MITGREEQFQRTAALMGEEAIQWLGASTVAVFGIGGVGGFCVEALARAGVGKLVLFDGDSVEKTNLNRQLIALHSTIGQAKVEVMKERILDICPQIEVEADNCFFLPDQSANIPFQEYDYIVDAVDTVTAKVELIVQAARHRIPVISCMGTGNKFDPTRFQVADIYETAVCPLARVMRRELKARGIKRCKVVYSRETAVHTELGRTPGSVSFIPPVAGLILAGEVIKDLTIRYQNAGEYKNRY